MKGIKRCRSWERSYALDTPYPHVNTCKATPHTRHTHRHYAHRRTPTPDVTNVTCGIRCDQRMSPTYPHHISLRAPPYTHCRCDQRTSTTYPRNVCPQRIPNTYPYNISLQHIPATYPHNISLTHIPIIYLQNQPHHMRLWTFLVTYGKLWLVLVNYGESW